MLCCSNTLSEVSPSLAPDEHLSHDAIAVEVQSRTFFQEMHP